MTTKQKLIRVAIYIRVSTVMQKNAESDVQQLKAVREYIKNIPGAIEIGLYCDNESGSVDNRADYQRLLSDMPLDKFDLIVTAELSRFSRNVRTLLEFVDLAIQYNIEFHALNQRFDITNAMGRAMLEISAVFASLERKQTAERTSRNKRQRAINGEWSGGKPPFAYTRSNATKEMSIVEEDAFIVKNLYADFLSGLSRAELARKYSLKSKIITSILTNPFYKGYIRYIVRKKDFQEEETIISKSTHPAIIDEETFDSVQLILKKLIKKKIRTNVSKDTPLLSGLVKCFCGKNMYHSHDRKNVYYRCRAEGCTAKSHHAHEFDKLIIAEILKFKDDSDKFNIEDSESANDEVDKNIKMLTKKHKKNEASILSYFQDAEANPIIRDACLKRIEQLTADNQLLDTQIAEEQRKLTEKVDKIKNRDFFFKKMESFDATERDEVKKVLKIIIDKVQFVSEHRYKLYLNV